MLHTSRNHLQSIKLGHELDIFHHSLTVNWNFLKKQVKLLVCHVQLKSSFNGRAELLLSQKTGISAVNVTEKRKKKVTVKIVSHRRNTGWVLSFPWFRADLKIDTLQSRKNLRRNPIGNRVISVFSGQKSCTRIDTYIRT